MQRRPPCDDRMQERNALCQADARAAAGSAAVAGAAARIDQHQASARTALLGEFPLMGSTPRSTLCALITLLLAAIAIALSWRSGTRCDVLAPHRPPGSVAAVASCE